MMTCIAICLTLLTPIPDGLDQFGANPDSASLPEPHIKRMHTPGTTALLIWIGDADSVRPLMGASVLLTGTKIGAMTDTAGWAYVEDIPEGLYSVRASTVHYYKRYIDIAIKEDYTLLIAPLLLKWSNVLLVH